MLLILFLSFLLVHSNLDVCTDFFTVIAEMEPWKTNGNEPCADTFVRMDEHFRILSAQMEEMNSQLTVYTTYKLQGGFCSFNYPNIVMKRVNGTELILSYKEKDMSKMLHILRHDWELTEYARTSDILRLLKGYKFQQSYIDPDVHLLSLNKSDFMKQYTGACVWDEEICKIEVTNAAFCLTRGAIGDLVGYLYHRIVDGSDSFFYTELGPSMFHKVLFNNHKLLLYSQNHPQHKTVSQIAAGVKEYKHKQLHITSNIRGNLRGGNYTIRYS